MKLRHLAIIIILLSAGVQVKAQYRYEFGGFAGGSFYMGDANPARLFSDIGETYGAIARYNINYRSALKLNVLMGDVSGSVSKDDPNFPALGSDVNFQTGFYDFGLDYEYNFFPYTRDKEPKASALSPYIFAGLGLTYASDLMFNIPFGLGVKYLVTHRMSIGAELGVRKVFADRLEDQGDLDDPNQINGSIFINNDYYTSFGFFITIGISDRVWKCRNL